MYISLTSPPFFGSSAILKASVNSISTGETFLLMWHPSPTIELSESSAFGAGISTV